jgi:hypothetical protein
MYRFPHPSLGKCVLPFLSANYNNSNNNRKNEEKKSEIIFLFFEDQKLSRNLRRFLCLFVSTIEY